MVPIPFAVNISTSVGLRISEMAGAAATLGAALAFYRSDVCRFFGSFRSSKTASIMLKGLKAVSLNLNISAASILVLVFYRRRIICTDPLAVFGLKLCAVLLLTFALTAICGFQPKFMFVMVLSGVASLLIYR